MQVSPKISHHQDFKLKPVFGEGREERWTSFQKIFRVSAENLYGSRLLNDAERRTDYKYRLLEADQKSEGVLIFSADLSNQFRSEGFKDCFEVKALHINRPELLSSFIEEIISQARHSKARSIAIRVSVKAYELLQSLGTHHFKEFESGSSMKTFGLVLESESKKRERSSERKESSSSYHRNPYEDQVSSRRRSYEIEKKDHSGFSGSERKRRPEESAQHSNPREELKKTKIDSSTAPPPLLNQKIDRCPIKKQYFNLIRNGQKTIEGRINSRPFNEWQPNQEVEFFCGTESVKCRIVKIVRHQSFGEMLEKEGFKPCLPDVRSLQDGIRIYDSIPGYADKAKRFGVLAIHIQVIK